MADPPWLFLSHSGAQKDFARRLYLELLHVGHSAFFDQDAQHSLPKGQPFPPRIVQACRGCKMGIVILSPEYLESLWPMLELEQLSFHNPSPHCILYPLFYRVPPADLSNRKKLRQWQDTWDSKASEWQSKVDAMQAASSPSLASHLQISINIRSWREALEKLRYQSGDVFHSNMDDCAYIQTVVSNICKTIPPPRARYLLDEHIRGMDRMQQVIEDLFQQAHQKSGNSTSGVCLGVWGLGGSGKTTLCKNMTNFYRRDFPGRSCLLALPTEKDEKQLVEAMREVILTLGRAKKDQIEKTSSIEVIMSHLKEGLEGHPVFLAIDNVWDWTIERAKQIMSMACTVGSKILVTSRSKQLLVPWRIVPVPSITEDEAVEVFKSLSFFLPDVVPPELEDLKGLVRLCFFEGQCHPLLLKMMGDMLRRRGGRINHEDDWKDLISRLRTRPMQDEENTILQVLETSFLALNPTLQNTFIDLVTCTSSEYIRSESISSLKYNGSFNLRCRFVRHCKWLSMIHDGFTEMDMRDQVIELEYHGLLETIEGEKFGRQINIHDLHKSVARRRAAGRDACLFEGRLSDLSIDHDKCRNTKYIVSLVDGTEVSSLMTVFTHCPKLEILILNIEFFMGDIAQARLSVRSMQYLRFLELRGCTFLTEIEGWEGTPNLVSLKLRGCIFLQKLGDMGCLQKLEKLIISESRCVPDLTQCGELKKLTFSNHKGVKHLASLGQPPKLKELNLSNNKNLEDVSTVRTFTGLRKLILAGCDKLESIMEGGSVFPLTDIEELHLQKCGRLWRIPDLQNLQRLKVVKAEFCDSLEMVELGVFAVKSLQVLDLRWCRSLGQLSKLKSGSLSIELAIVLCADEAWRWLFEEPFVNLQELKIDGFKSSNTASLVVRGMARLTVCELGSFLSLRKIQVERSLVKLSHLELLECPLLEEITGLDALPKLKELRISNCSSLIRFLGSRPQYIQCQLASIDLEASGESSIAQAPAPGFPMYLEQRSTAVFPTCLEQLSIDNCSSLTTLPPLPVAAALKELILVRCVSLTDISSLTTPLPFLRALYLESCSSLIVLPNLTHLTSLQSITLDTSLDTPLVRGQICKGVHIDRKDIG